MSKISKIAWTDSTFNPWIGCTKVSPGCANCYAEEMDRKRFSKTLPGCSSAEPKSHWGKGAPRYRTKTWGDPRRWNRGRFFACDKCGYRGDEFQQESNDNVMRCPQCYTRGFLTPARRRVFCASLADWLDDEVPIEWLADLLQLIFQTPHLDWLLLTKRPENWRLRVDAVLHWMGERHHELLKREPHRVTEPTLVFMGILSNWLGGHESPANVWIGTTVENQEYAERRIPQLLAIPARVRFLSVEPMLGPVDLERMSTVPGLGYGLANPLQGVSPAYNDGVRGPRIDWVICGGESGDNRRPFEVEWAQSLAEQCRAAGVPFFIKQDGHRQSGKQGRLPDALWGLKQFPGGAQ